jgi:hypothetical protein
MRTLPIVIAAVTLQASALHAQQYKRTPGDTLRYRETSRMTTSADGPTGAATINIESSGLIVITFLRGDSARVWYDSINAKIDSPMGDLGGDLARQMVNQPFTLRFLPDGTVETVSAPSMQGPAGGMVAQNAFHEWFPKLPAGLAIGSAWQDTVKTEMSPMPELKVNATTLRRFRVARDSTVAGLRVFVIETTGTSETTSTGSMSGMNIVSTLKGEFTGTILYAPNPGIVVGRASLTKMEGVTEMSGAMSMTMPQRSTMDARLELVRK